MGGKGGAAKGKKKGLEKPRERPLSGKRNMGPWKVGMRNRGPPLEFRGPKFQMQEFVLASVTCPAYLKKAAPGVSCLKFSIIIIPGLCLGDRQTCPIALVSGGL